MDLQLHRFRPLNVMVVDDDFLHLHELDKILSSFGTPYQIFKFIYPINALFTLRNQNHKFDILLCGIPLSNSHAFSLVHFAGCQFNIFVIQMISNYTDDAAFQGILIGASQCVAKPITNPQILKDIWQHVIRKRRDEITMNMVGPLGENSSSVAADGEAGPSCSNNTIGVKIVEEGESSRRDICDQDVPKKHRFVWSKEYQQVFLEAHDSIKPPEKVIPTKVLEYMKRKGVPNINRENVASHLQKYRMLLERNKDKNVINDHQRSTSVDDHENKLELPPISSSYDQDHETLAPQEQHVEPPPQNQPNENNNAAINEFGDQNNNDGINWEDFVIQSSALLDQTPVGNNSYYSDQYLNFNNSYDFEIMSDWDQFSDSLPDQQDELKSDDGIKSTRL